jgi:hypothetical protein
MKYLFAAFLFLVSGSSSFGQVIEIKEPSKTAIANIPYNDDDERRPEFPGGLQQFYGYIKKNLKYPELAKLIGINGRLIVSFVINKNGRVVKATPINCIGAGCESEAVRLLEASPNWKPGTQHGKPVSFAYSVPINFLLDKAKKTTYLNNLRKSKYGFVFNIKGVLYTIDEAEKILGKAFPSNQIEVAEPFYNYNNIEKFNMPNKKEVYLIILKKS